MTTAAATNPSVKTLATALIDAFNSRDLNYWYELLASDAEISYPGFRDQRGRDAARAYNTPFLVAFSDLHFRVTSMMIEGNRAVVCVHAGGTHDGDFATPAGVLPPSGRKGMVDGVFIITTRDGQIVREESHWDRMELLQQLGIGPS